MIENRYTVGLIFDTRLENVVLLRKNRPRWQEGKLNGIGGRVEEGDYPERTSGDPQEIAYRNCMIREANEEVGESIHSWTPVLRLQSNEAEIAFFSTVRPPFSYQRIMSRKMNDVGEQIVNLSLETLAAGKTKGPIIENLRWIIPMARYQFINFTHPGYYPGLIVTEDSACPEG